VNQTDPKQAKLKELVRAYVNERIDQRTKDLIRMAWWDLWHGPFYAHSPPEEGVGWETWPGAPAAWAEIDTGLQDIPRDLYVDFDCDLVLEKFPEGQWVQDPDDPNADEDGDVWMEPYTENIVSLGWGDIKRALAAEVGEYLA
jgi:hypothetical protein